VLDAVDDTPDHPFDAVALAAWFAIAIEAQEMLVFGADVPEANDLQMRAVSLAQSDL